MIALTPEQLGQAEVTIDPPATPLLQTPRGTALVQFGQMSRVLALELLHGPAHLRETGPIGRRAPEAVDCAEAGEDLAERLSGQPGVRLDAAMERDPSIAGRIAQDDAGAALEFAHR